MWSKMKIFYIEIEITYVLHQELQEKNILLLSLRVKFRSWEMIKSF